MADVPDHVRAVLEPVLALVLRPDGAYAGADPAFHRLRLGWQLRHLPWLVIKHPRGEIAGFVSWLDVPEIEATRDWSLEAMVQTGTPLPLQGGQDIYLMDVAVGPGPVTWDLWRALRAARPESRRIGWHRQRADGRRRFAVFSMR